MSAVIPFPKNESNGVFFMEGRKTPEPQPLIATHISVLCHCSDGRLREIQLEGNGKQAKKIYGYIEHIQGGKVKMKREPLLLLHDTPLVRQAIDAALNPPPHAGALDRLKSIFQRNGKH